MAKHNDLGQRGEEEVAHFLVEQGYSILERNWRYNKLEVDIIAINDSYILFVEVKTRSSTIWGNPEDSITPSKIKRMVEAADNYLELSNVSLPVRFDIASVVYEDMKFTIDYFDDAFLASLD